VPEKPIPEDDPIVSKSLAPHYLVAMLVLMATLFWALWDEDRFTWQDRISQTYITAATPLMEPEAFEIPAGHRHRLAHK